MSILSGTHRKAVLAFIFVTAVLDIVAMGIIIPVFPPLIEEFTGSNAEAGWINGVFVALWAAMQFIASPIIGSLSDQYGRRPVILLSCAGLAADYVLMALAPEPVVAGARSDHCRHHLVELHDGIRLHGRHHAARGQGARLRPDRRRLQRRLRARTAYRRVPRRDLAACAVLVCCRAQRSRFPLWSRSSCRNRSKSKIA